MITLTTNQQEVQASFIDFLFSDEQEMIINGYSGVGKTTLLRYLVEKTPETLRAIHSLLGTSVPPTYTITVAATTNPAVTEIRNKLPEQLLGTVNTCTVDSMLNLVAKKNFRTGGFDMVPSTRKAPPYFNHDIIFIDECSMLDKQKYDYLLGRIGPHTKIIYIQDPAQILSVTSVKPRPPGPLDCWIKRTTELTEIVRQKRPDGTMHPIASLGIELRKAIMEDIEPKLHSYLCDEIQIISPDEMELLVTNHALQGNFADGSSVFLAYHNAVVNTANSFIRDVQNFPDHFVTNEPVVSNGFYKVKPISGPDRDLHISNQQKFFGLEYQGKVDYKCTPNLVIEVDSYYHTSTNSHILANPFSHTKKLLKFLWESGHKTDYFRVKQDLADLRPSSASTVHKAQGSTAHTVFIDLANLSTIENIEGLNAFYRLVYVAVTRASHQIYIVE